MFLVIVFSILFILFFGAASYYPFPITAAQKNCVVDEDCKIVELNCCQFCECGRCVSVTTTAASEIREWKENNCIRSMCPLVSCIVPLVQTKAFCNSGQCGAKRTANCEAICYGGYKETLLEEAAKEIDMTKEGLLKQCNC